MPTILPGELDRQQTGSDFRFQSVMMSIEDVKEKDEEDEQAGENQVMVRLTGEAKNRKNKLSLSTMVERIPDESELHVVLGYAIVKKPQASTRRIIRDSDALLVRLVCKGLVHQLRHFP